MSVFDLPEPTASPQPVKVSTVQRIEEVRPGWVGQVIDQFGSPPAMNRSRVLAATIVGLSLIAGLGAMASAGSDPVDTVPVQVLQSPPAAEPIVPVRQSDASPAPASPTTVPSTTTPTSVTPTTVAPTTTSPPPVTSPPSILAKATNP